MEPDVDERIVKYEDGTPERTLQLALEELHKAAASSLSRFTCSGSQQVPAGVKLAFHDSSKARDLRSLHYLHLTGAALQTCRSDLSWHALSCVALERMLWSRTISNNYTWSLSEM